MAWQQESRRPVSATARTNARLLRAGLTPAERKLWRHLREQLPLTGTHFRRQVPLGPYVVDFVSLSEKLIIEVDGDQHGRAIQQAHDRRRTDYLAQQGFRVLRFSNNDVLTTIDAVLATIKAALADSGLSFHA